MESIGEMDKKHKTEYIIRASAYIVMNDMVKNTLIKHGIENVLTAMYNDLLEENNDNVDSIGIWMNYDGKEYENSIKLDTLDNMEKFNDEEIYPVFELFKLLSPKKDKKIKNL